MSLNPEVSKNKQKFSIVNIFFENLNDSLIVVDERSQYLNSPKDNICLFFHQLYDIFYFQLKDEKDKVQTLQNFTRSQLMTVKWPYCDLKQVQFVFKAFDQKQEKVSPNANVSWYRRLKVQLLPQIKCKQPEEDTIIKMSNGLKNEIQISYSKFKKFRVNQLFIYHELDKYRYTSLMVGDVILKHYQSLERLNLPPRMHQAIPIFTFQLFYKQTQDIYDQLRIRKFDFSTLLQELGDNQYEIKTLKQLYNKYKRQDIDQITLRTIIYLTSPFYKSGKQRKFLTNYFDGNIGPPEENKQFQLMSLMLNSLSKLSQGIQDSTIFISEKSDVDQLDGYVPGQFVRITTFTPAVRQVRRLQLDPKQNYILFQIEHVSAKLVSRYNGEQNGFSHIILPYNEYYVSNVGPTDRITKVQLYQLPTPKKLKSGLLIWIDESAKVLNINQMLENMQVMPIKNMKLYEIWLKKYFVVITSRKICIVYKKSGQNETLKAIQLTKQYLGQDKQLLVYTQEQQQELRQIKMWQVKVTNNQSHVIQHIGQTFSKPWEKNTICSQQCDCEIY